MNAAGISRPTERRTGQPAIPLTRAWPPGPEARTFATVRPKPGAAGAVDLARPPDHDAQLFLAGQNDPNPDPKTLAATDLGGQPPARR